MTIVVVHISRQQGQSLLNVGQEFRLKAGLPVSSCAASICQSSQFDRPETVYMLRITGLPTAALVGNIPQCMLHSRTGDAIASSHCALNLGLEARGEFSDYDTEGLGRTSRGHLHSLAEHAVAILISSGPDWTERTERLVARTPNLASSANYWFYGTMMAGKSLGLT